MSTEEIATQVPYTIKDVRSVIDSYHIGLGTLTLPKEEAESTPMDDQLDHAIHLLEKAKESTLEEVEIETYRWDDGSTETTIKISYPADAKVES